MSRIVKSFSLEERVAKAVESIEKSRRSQKVNEVLKEAFLGKKSNNDLEEIKKLFYQALENGSIESSGNEEGEKATEALNQIISMRKS